jgi:Ca2+-binding RTX toxin-like protein
MSRSIWLARAGTVLLGSLALGTLAVPAQAVTPGIARVVPHWSGTGAQVEYTAAGGSTNSVSFTRSGGKVVLNDRVAVKAGAGCKAVKDDKTKVICSSSRRLRELFVKLGAGNDTLVNHTNLGVQVDGGTGNDSLTGGSSTDYLVGGLGNDYLNGRSGNDGLYGRAGDDRLYGGPGNDGLDGDEGADKIFGSAGDDDLTGGSGLDYLTADAGNDVLDPGAGGDRSYGGPGADQLASRPFAGPDADYLSGGAGRDTITYAARTQAVSISSDGVKGNDGQQGEKETLAADFEVLIGGRGDDRIAGTAGADEVWGGHGDDTVDARDGNDVIWGEFGADTIDAGSGDDKVTGDGRVFDVTQSWPDNLRGGPGFDMLYYPEVWEQISIDLNGSTTGDGQNAGDTLDSSFEGTELRAGISTFTGNDADNVLVAGNSATAHGRGGDDKLTAYDGGSKLYGDAGDDTLVIRRVGDQPSQGANLLDGGENATAAGDQCVTPFPAQDTRTACER